MLAIVFSAGLANPTDSRPHPVLAKPNHASSIQTRAPVVWEEAGLPLEGEFVER
jgi:hypothetical protein